MSKIIASLSKGYAGLSRAVTPRRGAAHRGLIVCAAVLCSASMSFAEGDFNERLLIKAIRGGDLPLVQEMIEQVEDFDPTELRRPPLIAASSAGHVDIVRYLMSLGADPMRYDNAQAAMHFAVAKDHVQIVEIFLDAGVPLDFRTKQSWTPPLLMHAASSNSVETMRLLFDRGADINVRDKCNDPPIAASAYFGHLEATELLIELKADLTTRSVFTEGCSGAGATALSYAVGQGHPDVAEVLRQAGAVE